VIIKVLHRIQSLAILSILVACSGGGSSSSDPSPKDPSPNPKTRGQDLGAEELRLSAPTLGVNLDDPDVANVFATSSDVEAGTRSFTFSSKVKSKLVIFAYDYNYSDCQKDGHGKLDTVVKAKGDDKDYKIEQVAQQLESEVLPAGELVLRFTIENPGRCKVNLRFAAHLEMMEESPDPKDEGLGNSNGNKPGDTGSNNGETEPVNDGLGRWEKITAEGAPSGFYSPYISSYAWTGEDLIIFRDDSIHAFNLASKKWRSIQRPDWWEIESGYKVMAVPFTQNSAKKILLVGDESTDKPLAQGWIYDATGDTWEQAHIPEFRYQGTLVFDGTSSIYLIGGCEADSCAPLKYDIDDKRWSALPSMAFRYNKFRHSKAYYYEGKIIVTDEGWGNLPGYILDLENSKLGAMPANEFSPPASRYNVMGSPTYASNFSDGKIYVFGSGDSSSPDSRYVFDLESLSWQKQTDRYAAIKDHRLFATSQGILKFSSLAHENPLLLTADGYVYVSSQGKPILNAGAGGQDRVEYISVWTGKELIIWGQDMYYGSGGILTF
jgi:hypothetical protein